jgi:hypothetical protein
MALLRKRGRLSAEDREELTARLRDLERRREEHLIELGGLAADLHRSGAVDPGPLSEPAAAVAALEAEMNLVRRGLDEGLSAEQLNELAK